MITSRNAFSLRNVNEHIAFSIPVTRTKNIFQTYYWMFGIKPFYHGFLNFCKRL